MSRNSQRSSTQKQMTSIGKSVWWMQWKVEETQHRRPAKKILLKFLLKNQAIQDIRHDLNRFASHSPTIITTQTVAVVAQLSAFVLLLLMWSQKIGLKTMTTFHSVFVSTGKGCRAWRKSYIYIRKTAHRKRWKSFYLEEEGHTTGQRGRRVHRMTKTDWCECMWQSQQLKKHMCCKCQQ